jgi:hypothetical protein
MNISKFLVLIAAWVTLIGCEHQDGKTGNALSAVKGNNISADPSETNMVDSKSVVQSAVPVSMMATNWPLQDNQQGADSGGIIIYNGGYGYGFDNFSLIDELTNDVSTNSFP